MLSNVCVQSFRHVKYCAYVVQKWNKDTFASISSIGLLPMVTCQYVDNKMKEKDFAVDLIELTVDNWD